LTYLEAKRLGIGHLHPQAPQEVRPRPHDDRNVEYPDVYHDRLNKSESRFRREILLPALEARHIARYEFETVKFRLAGNTWYTPDFIAVISCVPGRTPTTRTVCIDVKGFLREDAAQKIKGCADKYPELGWYLAYHRRGSGWEMYRVTTRGISTAPTALPWTNGV
jgi:hypothetical protein